MDAFMREMQNQDICLDKDNFNVLILPILENFTKILEKVKEF